MPATGDSRDPKKEFCLQEVIVGAAVGEGKRKNTSILRGSVHAQQVPEVVYGVHSENHVVGFLPMEMKRKAVKVKSKNGEIHLDSTVKRKSMMMPEKIGRTGGKTNPCWSQSQGRGRI